MKSMRIAAAICLALLLSTTLAGCGSTATKEGAVENAVPAGMFTNPLFANGADPWLEYWDGNYYLTTTTWTSQLVMRKSPTLDGLATAAPVNVWSDAELSRCCNFWAFEFHRLNGPNGWRWYLMYTSGQHGTLDHQHLSVLESAGDDPMGPYVYKGEMMPDTWNIDGTYLEHNGQLYLLWSEWVGDEQLNWISKMTTPWSIEGPRVVITRPEEEWEKSERKVNEGAEILKKDGRTFLIYSASFCDTPDYKLAMKELTGKDPMNPEDWTKYPEPVFQRGNGVFGPGHNGFFKSPDGTEDWLVYHGNSKETDGCGASRSVRAQKFVWNDDGTPNFGEPIPEGEAIILPSGEDGPLVTNVQGAHMHIVNPKTQQCLATDGDKVVQASCETESARWVIDHTADGKYRLANAASGQFMGNGKSATKNQKAVQSAWVNNDYQKWQVATSPTGLTSFTNAGSGELLSACDSTVNYGETSCNEFRVQPADKVAISSVQSGRVLQAENCGKNVTNVSQAGWSGSECQQWQFASIEEGFFNIKAGDQCMTITNRTIVPGTNVEAGTCESPYAQWRFELLEDGAVKISNRESNHTLDLANCALSDATNIGQTQWFGTDCQKFHLRKIPE